MITIKNKDDAKKYGFKRRACAFALARKSSTNPGVVALYGVFFAAGDRWTDGTRSYFAKGGILINIDFQSLIIELNR